MLTQLTSSPAPPHFKPLGYRHDGFNFLVWPLAPVPMREPQHVQLEHPDVATRLEQSLVVEFRTDRGTFTLLLTLQPFGAL